MQMVFTVPEVVLIKLCRLSGMRFALSWLCSIVPNHEEKLRILMLTMGLCLLVAWLGCHGDFSVATAQRPGQGLTADPWRRTVNGWELRTSWRSTDTLTPEAAFLHPGLVASFQLLSSLGGLLAFSNKRVQNSS